MALMTLNQIQSILHSFHPLISLLHPFIKSVKTNVNVPGSCFLSCLASPPKFGFTFQFEWGLRVEVEHLEDVVLAIDPLHHLLRPPLEAYEVAIHH